MDNDNITSRKREREEDDEVQDGTATAHHLALHEATGKPPDGWTVVEGSMKKRKLNNKQRKKAQKKAEKEALAFETNQGEGSTKPTLAFSPIHTIQRCLRVYNLQQLVLYCLADGSAPHWVSIRNHAQVRKAVVLMVPGLERAMFTGELHLEDKPALESNGEATHTDFNQPKELDDERDPTETTTVNDSEVSQTPQRYPASSKNPDDFLPLEFTADTLPAALKPLADIFPQVWPVKAPGDDKFSRLHSPKYGMLTANVPQKSEDKKKGPQPPRGSAEWVDDRTPITNFIALREELLENDYVLHPAHFAASEKEIYAEMRRAAKAEEEDGWRNALIDDLDACPVPDSELEGGSITAGRTVLAIDCEMCIVEGGEYALTRISIVGWDGEVVLDEFVKPEKRITDYLTA